MNKNINKGEAYHLVLSNLNLYIHSTDIFHLIRLIAACESIISDRLSAFLGGTKNSEFIELNKKEKYISFGNMLNYSKKELSL